MVRCWVLLLISVSLWGCVKPLQGPEADLSAIAAPDPAPPAPRVPPALPAGPVLGAGEFKAWVPPYVQPNGDRSEGHWLVISLTPPASETLEPVTPMPRAPKPFYGQKQAPHGQQVPVAPGMAPPVPPPPPAPEIGTWPVPRPMPIPSGGVPMLPSGGR